MTSQKPLKIGVQEDLQQGIKDKALPFGQGSLKAASGIVAIRPPLSISKSAFYWWPRFDLTGQSCGEVTPEQQQAATMLMDKARDRGNAHDKGQ